MKDVTKEKIQKEKGKKTLWKKWWFWIIVIIFLLLGRLLGTIIHISLEEAREKGIERVEQEPTF